MKIATLLKNDSKTERLDLFLDTESKCLYYFEDGSRQVIEQSEGWTTKENYVDVCNGIWGTIWELKFEEIQED